MKIEALLQKIEALEKRLEVYEKRHQEDQEKIQKLQDQCVQFRNENKLLREKIDLILRRAFSAKSEAFAHPELGLKVDENSKIIELPVESSKKIKPEASSPAPRRKRVPADLPREIVYIDPLEVTQNPEAFRQIGEEISEKFDYEAGRFYVQQFIRRKYVSKVDLQKPPIIAPLPPVLQERLEAGPGLLAWVMTSKFVDHLPLYRLEQIMLNRHGVEISRQNLARWVGLCADWLKPLYRIIGQEIFKEGYVQCDETPIRYLSPGHGKTKKGYLWVVRDPRPGGEAFYHWDPGRSSEVLEDLIPPEFNGVLQIDAFSAYETYQNKHSERITLACCWAHARRKFFEAQEHYPLPAKRILLILRRLYRQEALWREQNLTLEQIGQNRLQQSAPWIKRIFDILKKWTLQKRFLPKSSIGMAISYTLKIQTKLELFLKDPRVQMDNNLVENAIRPTAIGKKNWLFIGCEDVGDRAAILYTITQSCKLHGVNPFEYFKHVFTVIPQYTNKTVHLLTPKNYAESKKSALLSQAA